MLVDDLGARPDSLSYDFFRKRGELRLCGMDCTDMTGCIALFTAIDPDVREIQTFNEGGIDTTYKRFGHFDADIATGRFS